MPIIVPDPPAERAAESAVARRQLLEQHLAAQRESGLAARSFRELPEGLRVPDQRGFLEGPPAAAEFARLHWQVRSWGLLLLERVVDVVEALIYDRQKPLDPGSVDVSLRPIRSTRGSPPWRVVISAPKDLNLAEGLREYSTFFGVGVFLQGAARYKAFSRCMGLGGLEGVVGGVLRMASPYHDHEEYLATCAHVIADGCGSLRYGRSAHDQGAPDAVLLRPTPCFRYPTEGAQPVYPADESSTARLQIGQVPVTLHHPERRRSRGWVKYPVAAVVGPTKELIRFPHYSVQPFRYRVGFLRWPVLRPFFAVPGDSGSWVLEGSTRIWLGMVVAGFDHDSDTLVADGRALVDYYSSIVTGRLPRAGDPDLLPYTWS